MENDQKDRPLTVNYLAVKTGIDHRRVRRLLENAGCFPPGEHTELECMTALKPPVGSDSGELSIRDRKVYEDWRRLLLQNDEREKILINANECASWLGGVYANCRGALWQKLVNEAPSKFNSADMPHARRVAEEVFDQVMVEWQRIPKTVSKLENKSDNPYA